MRRAEGVVDVDVGQRRQRRGERRRRSSLPRRETAGSPAAQPWSRIRRAHARRLPWRRRRCSRRRRRRPSQQLAEPRGDRPQRKLRRRLALRPAEVRGEDDRGAAIERVLNGRERRRDPRLVADRAVLDRDVEVDANERARAGQVEIADGILGHRSINPITKARHEGTKTRKKSKQIFVSSCLRGQSCGSIKGSSSADRRSGSSSPTRCRTRPAP